MATTWRIEGDHAIFENDLVSGRILTAGHYQGMRSLVHRPTGVEIAAGETLPGLVAPYRVFGNGKRYADVRERTAQVKLVSEGVCITHAADADNPLEINAVYSWQGAALDVRYSITIHEEMRGFEIGIASYLAAGFRAFVSRQSNEWGEKTSQIVPVDVNPMTDVYALFPRSEAELKTIFDGRWDLPPYPVRYAVPAYYADALAYRTHARSGVTALGMADPKDCVAICIPVNNPPEDPDPSRGYQAIYFYLFGRDAGRGEMLSTRVRWIIGQNVTDQDVLASYKTFTQEL